MTVSHMSSFVVGDEGCIVPSRNLLCLCQTTKNYAAHAWHHSIHVWLLGRSSCSAPSTKELHGMATSQVGLFCFGTIGVESRERKAQIQSWKCFSNNHILVHHSEDKNNTKKVLQDWSLVKFTYFRGTNYLPVNDDIQQMFRIRIKELNGGGNHEGGGCCISSICDMQS